MCHEVAIRSLLPEHGSNALKGCTKQHLFSEAFLGFFSPFLHTTSHSCFIASPCTFRYDRYNAMKAQNPEIKTLLAVGGWNMASEPFTAMVATAASRSEFARSTVPFLR